MNTDLRRKVDSARRRLILGRFGRALGLAVFVALLVSTIAIAAMAIVPLQEISAFIAMDSDAVTPMNWTAFWLIATGAIALLVAIVATWCHKPSRMDVATQIDQRFGLRERLSSTLAVSQSETDRSPLADALDQDAIDKVKSIRIADQFPLRVGRAAWLPLSILPILVAMIMVVEPAGLAERTDLASVDGAEVRQVKAAAADLKKRVQQQRKDAEERGLKESTELFEKMERQLDKITGAKSLNRKDALIELNELKDQIQERKDRLGSPDQIRKMMSQMNGLEGGPAKKIAEQIQKGDFGKAAEEMKKLAEQIKDGKLDEKEKEKLAEQIKKLSEELKKATDKHEQNKQDLKEKIEQAKQEGRSEDAAKMQQKLNEAEAADSQMNQMQQMAAGMQAAADAMKSGDSQAAADALSEMSEELGNMQQEMSEMENLQDVLDDLSQSKSQMNCKSCNGDGCQSCEGGGFGDGQKPGSGMGRGTGEGDRPEEESETNRYDTQVRGEVKRGKSIIAGFADGPNRKGVTREQIKNVIESSITDESDPLEDQILPRDEREQTRQYFDRLREGS